MAAKTTANVAVTRTSNDNDFFDQKMNQMYKRSLQMEKKRKVNFDDKKNSKSSKKYKIKSESSEPPSAPSAAAATSTTFSSSSSSSSSSASVVGTAADSSVDSSYNPCSDLTMCLINKERKLNLF